jgi:hypothetical protein
MAKIALQLDELKLEQGRLLSRANDNIISSHLRDYEFKIYSQWGEDGIIQRLTKEIEIPNRTFIEFGVEDFSESNCRFLMMKDLWSGFIADGSAANIQRLQGSYFYWKYDLTAVAAFMTRENVNDVLSKSGLPQDLGLMSIDLDGVDYHVLEAVDWYKPRILIVEFNALFGKERKITVPYKQYFDRTAEHHSNLYFGASLPALATLADRKGFALVGTNSASSNAFFVRRSLLTRNVVEVPVENAYSPSFARESRDKEGKLNFISDSKRLDLIRGLPVLNIETGQVEPL